MLQKMVIEGGRPLEGSLAVSGAKNAVLPILCASLLATGPCEISNVPKLADVVATCHLLSHLGVEVERLDGGEEGATSGQRVRINPSGRISPEAPYDIVRRMRASVLVLGPLVARLGEARVSLPGGCAIGERPIDQHLKGLEAMGAVIELKGGYVEAKAKRLRGARIVLDIATVTGTENLMMAATLAEGTTFIENAAREPEIVDLANFLVALGAKIKGAGSSVIEIEGVEALGQADHRVIPDRIETGTYMVAAAITGGDVRLKGADLRQLDALVDKLKAAGVGITTDGADVLVSGPRVLQPVNIRTSPFPGFPTDMQAQFMTLMTLAEGASTVVETLFENRFMHVPELRRMGAEIDLHGNTASVKGVRRLGGAQVMATDLRASASLVLAGLAARGTTEVLRIYHLDRGYEALDQKLRAIGARVERQSM